MKPIIVASIAVLALLPLIPPAGAEHSDLGTCPTYDINETVGPLQIFANAAGQFVIDVDQGLFYIVHDHIDVTALEQMDALVYHLTHPQGGIGAVNWLTSTTEYVGWDISIWIYQESNGVQGLQRHDDYCVTPGYNSFWQADWIAW